ncbi:MAG: hypothetical protein M3Y85_11930 [Bacteroidota bacterium]|nr:hypothetical protein [Bacteroidota bacterium]
MMKTILYLLIPAMLCHASAMAQFEYKTQNYTHNLSPVKVSFSFLNMENFITPITAGILVEGQLNDKLFYNVQLRQGYVRNFLVSSGALLTTQKESKGTVFEAGIDWPFADVIKQGKVKVATSSSFDGSYVRERYFNAVCDVRSYWAVSGGVMEYTRPKYMNSDSAEYIISGSKNIKATGENFTHFNQTTFGAYGGIAHRKIRKAIVVSNGVSYRRFYSTKFYAQLLIGGTTVGDIIYNKQTYKIDNAKQMPIGYRLGWQWDQMGVVTGFEFGKMPGVNLDTPVKKDALSKIFVNNPFLNYARVTFHFNLWNSDKNYFSQKK